MYTQFYGFSEKPFNVTPDPKFLYQTPSHREALASMIYGIKERKGFISITGEVGTGKTTLIYTLLNHLLNEKVKAVFIFQTHMTFQQLLKNLLLELELPIIEEDKTTLLRQINEYLIQRLSHGENLAIIIDEAQNLPMEVIEELRMLSNLETPKLKLLQIILVGQPELEVKLNSEELRQLRQRIGIRRQIRSLTQEECKAYIDYRLNLVGNSSSNIFTSEAVSLICDYGKGIPRIINTICDNALLIGYGLAQKKIDVNIIHEVIKDMDHSIRKILPHPEPVLLSLSQPSAFKLSFTHNKMSALILSLFCLVLLFPFGWKYFPKSPMNIQTSSNGLQREKPESAKAENQIKQIVIAKKDDSFFSLIRKYYNATNTTLTDYILESNPNIKNINLIQIHQQIKIPEITEKSLIIPSSDHIYKIRLGTFINTGPSRLYENEPVLKGKEIEIIPRKVSPSETWYRIMVGKFNNEEECLKIISLLKKKGLLPIFKHL